MAEVLPCNVAVFRIIHDDAAVTNRAHNERKPEENLEVEERRPRQAVLLRLVDLREDKGLFQRCPINSLSLKAEEILLNDRG